MSESPLKDLRIAFVLVGIIFIFGIYSLMIAWPSGWTWHTGHSDYPLMNARCARSPPPFAAFRKVAGK